MAGVVVWFSCLQTCKAQFFSMMLPFFQAVVSTKKSHVSEGASELLYCLQVAHY